jgi:cytochrome P450
MVTAVEELLRAYAPVTMARLVSEDVDFRGHRLKEGDWLLLPFPAANRDPEFFSDADEIRLDRTENRHAAFGLGIHRCIGSNLARMELQVALEEWMKRYPDFELSDPELAGAASAREAPSGGERSCAWSCARPRASGARHRAPRPVRLVSWVDGSATRGGQI